MRRLSLFICVACIAFLGWSGFTAQAQTAQTLNCTFEDDFAHLDKIKNNPSADYLANVRAELAVRKEILRKIVACGAREVELLKEKVTTTTLEDKTHEGLKNKFLTQLDESTKYYETSGSRIDTLGLRGSQELARSLREWRTHTYDSLAEEALNFLIWEKNQNIFKTARNRFAEIGKAIESLKIADTEDIHKLFEEAKGDLEAAEVLNRSVKQSLESFDSSQETFLLTKQSLEALSKTYQKFFDLSQTVQKVVPR